MNDLKANEPTAAAPKQLPILDFIQRIDQMRVSLHNQAEKLREVNIRIYGMAPEAPLIKGVEDDDDTYYLQALHGAIEDLETVAGGIQDQITQLNSGL